jgi:hypothetical protein
MQVNLDMRRAQNLMQYMFNKLPHNSFPTLNYFRESIFSINRKIFYEQMLTN